MGKEKKKDIHQIHSLSGFYPTPVFCPVAFYREHLIISVCVSGDETRTCWQRLSSTQQCRGRHEEVGEMRQVLLNKC